MPRSVVTNKQLMRPGFKFFEGIPRVLNEIRKRLPSDPETGIKLKNVFLEAAKPIQTQARKNIAGLPINEHGRRLLSAMVVVGRGPRKHPNAFVAMYQFADGVNAERGATILNPYWVEFGTAERTDKSGHRTGHMQITPYFRPAVTQARSEVRQLLKAGLAAILVDAK